MDLEALERSYFTAADGTRLAYVERGSGRPILLLHGWSSSMNWFKENVEFLAERYRVLALDFRGHGDSDKSEGGHTMEVYARDVHAFVAAMRADGALMVGWSMGALVLWNYVLQFGRGQAAGMVFVGQSASDLRTPEYDDGIVDAASFHDVMRRLQEERPALLKEWMAAMRMEASPDELEWMEREYARCPGHIATVAFYHQTTVNALPAFPKIDFPTQVYFGTDPKMYDIRQGYWLRDHIPSTELVVFERSGHVPMLEEPGRFNRELDAFARRVLGAG